MALTVLQVIPKLDAGGAERTTIDVAAALAARGDVALVASAGGRMAGELAAAGGELVAMDVASRNPLTVWANAGRLAQLAQARGARILHARSRAPAWSALWAARRAGLAFVTTYHGVYNARTPLKRWYNSVMARGDAVIANSAFTRDHLLAEHGGDPARVVVIPRGVDVARFDPAAVNPARAAALAAQWDLPADLPVVMLPARVTRWKGQGLLLEAAGLARTPACYVCVGGAEESPGFHAELAAGARAAGIADRFLLVGHCADMPAALTLADVVVTPSLDPEAFGRTAAEAQAMARPVIAADHGGARETVAHGASGWLVPPGQAGALAAAIDQALALPAAARAAMGAAGQAHIRAGFTKAALQAATLAVYDRLCAR